MPIPPPLSAQSADRMTAVVDAADEKVDSGTNPNEAIAKAAADHGLPVGHVPLVVQAFNTARAVRQLGAKDVWEKAAAHPVADTPKVIALLAFPPVEKKASVLTDYYVPPEEEKVARDYSALKQLADLIPASFKEEKRAAEEKKKEKAEFLAKELVDPKLATRDNRLSIAGKAADAVEKFVAEDDRMGDDKTGIGTSRYKAVKLAAMRVNPATADVFGYLEATRPDYAWRATSTKPIDPTVSTAHPLVKLAVEIANLRAAYKVPQRGDTPEGFKKIAEDWDRDWYVKLPYCDVLNRPLPEVLPAVKEASTPAPKLSIEAAELKAEDSDGAAKEAGFGGGFGTVVGGAGKMLTNNPMTKGLFDQAKVNDFSSDTHKLDLNLDRLDEQDSIHSLLSDQRFAKADPGTVIGAYRQLASIAPSAMRNSAVAADFIQRRLQTGPLSYYDLTALTNLEKNLAQTRQFNRQAQQGDEDD